MVGHLVISVAVLVAIPVGAILFGLVAYPYARYLELAPAGVVWLVALARQAWLGLLLWSHLRDQEHAARAQYLIARLNGDRSASADALGSLRFWSAHRRATPPVRSFMLAWRRTFR